MVRNLDGVAHALGAGSGWCVTSEVAADPFSLGMISSRAIRAGQVADSALCGVFGYSSGHISVYNYYEFIR